MAGWKSINDMLSAINKEDYLVLRNYNNILKILGTDDDIDILCKDMHKLVNRLGAVCISDKEPCYNYYVVVDDKKLLLDIRTVGDGYYDSKWERRMLEEKVPCNDFFILDKENYRYSFLYHVLVQKHESMAGKYKGQIEDLFGINIENKERCCKLLIKYLRDQGYQCTKPLDQGVYINDSTLHYISSQIDL